MKNQSPIAARGHGKLFQRTVLVALLGSAMALAGCSDDHYHNTYLTPPAVPPGGDGGTPRAVAAAVATGLAETAAATMAVAAVAAAEPPPRKARWGPPWAMPAKPWTISLP